MSNALMLAECQRLQKHFSAKKGKQSELWLAYEQSKSYGMAYLALWAVLEDFAVPCQRLQLRAELGAWLVHLDDVGSKAPPKISVGKFDIAKDRTAKIPAELQLHLALSLETAPQLYAALASKRKYRDKRNAIAHSGEVVSAKVYEDFKAVALAAIAEIDAWLEFQINIQALHS